ncbi:glycosyl transferase [Fibrobacter sp. UWB1]|uniref:glycosyltransferase n=1 Tax=Fibrobacter sp. UWB1 TaxID=1964355 RepID=UPI000B51F1FF|nr:glycosyltransferase [Fibrobacter sp. UWB1]OWV26299.1 glycosyl transferase [Fibrobacter sp. UWB1]
MKVLQINSVCGIRSTGRICTDLAEVLEQNGHECKIAYGRETVPEKYRKYAVRIGSDFDVKCHALQSRIFDNTGFGSRRATEKFIEWVKEYDPDVIHLHNIHGYYINIEFLFNYLAKADKPVVWTLHDCWTFTGHCAYYSYVKCDKWKTGCYNCPQKKRYPSSLLLDASKKNWLKKKALFTSVKKMTLVTPSKWLANEVKQSFLSRYPIKVIPNGIDLNVFKPTPSNFREKNGLVGKKVILGVASIWEERKGLNDFVELSKILDDNYKIVLVGLSEKQKKELPDNIIKITRTNNVRELAEIYTAADVFLNPSREETMGLTTVEAMACGTPVVVSNYTAVPETVIDDCGIVIKEIAPKAVLNVIECGNLLQGNCAQNAQTYEKFSQYKIYLRIFEEIKNK